MFGEKGIGQFVKHAKSMEEKMKKMNEEVLKLTVTGQSGAGLVSVTMNGNQAVQKIQIDDEAFQEDKIVLEELIAFAFNDALKRLAEQKKDKLSSVSDLLNIDRFKMPF
ncbi:MAG: YbaB/EbfC family nucleoid-associated protein [Endozoicomonadaceae bacterium]|nr:YbaB/EbfC family nucleoid-associated protein [Endozoicomonadaceae bacterium]